MPMASKCSKKKKRYPPSRYWMLCFEETISASMPARSRMASSLAASKGIGCAAPAMPRASFIRCPPHEGGRVPALAERKYHRPSRQALRRLHPRPQQLVDDGVVQRLERSVDDVLGHADREPRVARSVGGFDQ